MGNCGSSGNEAAKPAARKTAVSKQQVTKKETSPAAKAKEEKKTSPVSKPAASTGPSVSVRPPAPASPPSGTPSRSPLDKPARVGSSSNNDIPVTTTNGKPDKKSKGGPVRYHPTSFNPDDTSLGLPRDKEMDAIIFVEMLRMRHSKAQLEHSDSTGDLVS
eukprot:TRINITY_DN62152_c0_g1_i1.p1 TRINITY_DN62152_c0_g1~~TRINITY_DN62152_c0_g1_i1.p1  ORF type:complete len:161 (+),score=55.30 TRINITY_DN62152_c0_g1_i1:148-630(+)